METKTIKIEKIIKWQSYIPQFSIASMYTIQKHKAKTLILGTFGPIDNGEERNVRIFIEYNKGIPEIVYGISARSNNFQEFLRYYYLECLYWNDYYDMREEMRYIFDIYGIPDIDSTIFRLYSIDTEQYAYLLDIDKKIKIGVRFWGDHNFESNISDNSNKYFYITIPNDEHKEEPGILLFIIDPLQAIEKMQDKFKDPTLSDPIIRQFFEYYRDSIIEQDRELLTKYLLISHIIEEFMVIDIMHFIVDNIINLLLV